MPDVPVKFAEKVATIMAHEGLPVEVRFLVVPDYVKDMETEDFQREFKRTLRFSFPEQRVILRLGPGPFEDDEGVNSHFERSTKAGLTIKRLSQAVRTDLMTSIVKLLRNLKMANATMIIAVGQGALIALVSSWPPVVEAAMQLRNVQPEEAHSLAVSWGNVRLIVGLNPRMSKKGVGLDLLRASLPEAFQPHPLKAVPCFGVLDRNVPNREEMTELLYALGIAEMENFHKIA